MISPGCTDSSYAHAKALWSECPLSVLPFANYSCKSWNLEFLLLSDITLGGWREILDI